MKRLWGHRNAKHYFGFAGNRAGMACLHSRSEGASQSEVNEVSARLGSPQEGYLRMLDQAIKWDHRIVEWEYKKRGGKVYKLIYNPNHTARKAAEPPDDWKERNKAKAPPGATVQPWK